MTVVDGRPEVSVVDCWSAISRGGSPRENDPIERKEGIHFNVFYVPHILFTSK